MEKNVSFMPLLQASYFIVLRLAILFKKIKSLQSFILPMVWRKFEQVFLGF